MKKPYALALALILVVFWVGNTSTVPVKASPTVHNVGPGRPFPTITAALTSGLVQPGDVIHVWDNGTTPDYQENLVITIPRIKIIGEVDVWAGVSKINVFPAEPGICLMIQAPDVTIMGLGIWDPNPQVGDVGIAIWSPASRCTIMHSSIIGFDWGILISDSPENQILDNTIQACRVIPPPPFCSTGVFIYGPYSFKNVVRGNYMVGNSLQVQTNHASNNTITFNNFNWNGPPDNIPQAAVAAGDINIWCDYSLQKGNWWNDPSPQPPYVIDPNNVDQFCGSYYDWTTMPWDINRDLRCDIKDVATAAVAFGTIWSMAKWNPVADINGDTKIDIRDIAIIAWKFGWTDP